ncbi:MAG: hypothetical protein ABSC54_03725 [Smithellaceae bacterium]|jgi:hypothetical protein
MKANPFPILFLCLLCLVSAAGDETCALEASAEKYRYEAIPLGDEDGQKETIDMEITRNGLNLRYRMKTVSPAGLEEIEIATEPKGRFLSASRRFSPAGKEAMTTEKIWREDGKAYLKRGTETEGSVRSFDLPPEKSFAVDGSLLVLLRDFPFGGDEAWAIYMVDFSGSNIAVTLRQAGIESVNVPAGIFDCYKMEVTVEIPIFRPHIIYWVTKKEPHFLVKSIGKRGPFTRSYATSLLSIK